MKQTTKTLLSMGAFALLALAVAFAAAWVGRDEEQKAEKKEKSEKLFDLDKTKARSIALSKAGKLIANIKRDDEKSPWKILEPVKTDADEATVNAMFEKLSTLKQKSEVEGMDLKLAGVADNEDWQKTGIEDSARISIRFSEEAKKMEGLLIGEENPFDHTVYVRRAGISDKTVRTIAKADETPFDKGLFDLRDKRVVHIDDSASISKLEVAPEAAALHSGAANSAGGFAYEIARDGTSWKLAKPVEALGDSATIDRLITSIKGLRATQVAAETSAAAALAQYGLAFPKVTVSLTVVPAGGKDSFVRKLLIGQPAPSAGSVAVHTYAKRDDSGTIYEIDSQLLRDLSKELFDLRDKTVLKFDREAVRRIEFSEKGKETISIARHKDAPADGGIADETFELLAPKQGPAKKAKLSGNLYALANIKAAAFTDEPFLHERAMLPAERTIVLYGENDVELARLAIFGETAAGTDKKKQRRQVQVLAPGNPRFLEIDSAALNDFPRAVADVLDAPPPATTANDAGTPVTAGAPQAPPAISPTAPAQPSK